MKPLKPPTRAEKARRLLERLDEYNADYHSLLAQLEELRKTAMEGMEQEKVHMKHDEPFVLTERYPQVAQQAIMGKLQVVQVIEKLAAEEATGDDFVLNVNLMGDTRGTRPTEL